MKLTDIQLLKNKIERLVSFDYQKDYQKKEQELKRLINGLSVNRRLLLLEKCSYLYINWCYRLIKSPSADEEISVLKKEGLLYIKPRTKKARIYRNIILSIPEKRDIPKNNPELLYSKKELKNFISKFIEYFISESSINKKYQDRFRYILCSRFCLEGHTFKTHRQLGEELNISTARVAQIEKAILKRLKHPKYIKILKNYGYL